MADKEKPTAMKKTYKKPTADRLSDENLAEVTGGEGEDPGAGYRCRVPGFAVAISCRPAGPAAIQKCQAGGAAIRCAPAGGVVGLSCNAGGSTESS